MSKDPATFWLEIYCLAMFVVLCVFGWVFPVREMGVKAIVAYFGLALVGVAVVLVLRWV